MTWERSGAWPNVDGELNERMRDAGLEPDSRSLAEIAMCTGRDAAAYRRWALLTRSLLPKIVECGLATEETVLDLLDRQLRDELMDIRGLLHLSWLMIGQWARKR